MTECCMSWLGVCAPTSHLAHHPRGPVTPCIFCSWPPDGTRHPGHTISESESESESDILCPNPSPNPNPKPNQNPIKNFSMRGIVFVCVWGHTAGVILYIIHIYISLSHTYIYVYIYIDIVYSNPFGSPADPRSPDTVFSSRNRDSRGRWGRL